MNFDKYRNKKPWPVKGNVIEGKKIVDSDGTEHEKHERNHLHFFSTDVEEHEVR